MMIETMKNINCVPPYWKEMVKNHAGMEDCYTTKQLKAAYHYAKNYNEILASYESPCIEMTVLSTLDEKVLPNQADTEIALYYGSKSYQEIENLREFGFESFWSAVGGFVGIFMGYSLLQLPEFIGNIPSFLQCCRQMLKEK